MAFLLLFQDQEGDPAHLQARGQVRRHVQEPEEMSEM